MMPVKDEIAPAMIDPDRIDDVFCETLGSVDRIGSSCFRFTFFVTYDLGDGEIDRRIVARLIFPREELAMVHAQVAAVLAGRPFLAATDDDRGLSKSC